MRAVARDAGRKFEQLAARIDDIPQLARERQAKELVRRLLSDAYLAARQFAQVRRRRLARG